MRKSCLSFLRNVIVVSCAASLLLVACQTTATAAPNTTASASIKPSTTGVSSTQGTETSPNTTSTIKSTSIATSSSTTKTSATTETTIAVGDAETVKITLAKLEDNFVVHSGKPYEFVNPSIIYRPVILTPDPILTKEITSALNDKMQFINDLWERGTEEKAAALKDATSCKIAMKHEMQSSISNGILTLYSVFMYTEHSMEYGPPQYFNLFIDETDGHILSFDEFLERNGLDKAVLVDKAMQIMSDESYEDGLYKDTAVTTDEMNADNLFYDGQSLLLLVENKDYHAYGYPHIVNLGK